MTMGRRRKDSAGTSSEYRLRIARAAARLMHEQGIDDLAHARRKAIAGLGPVPLRHLPELAEIEQALLEHRRLFSSNQPATRLEELRDCAREAMRYFTRFQPRLVGSVLAGSADRHSAVQIHLHSAHPDEVAFFLAEQGIPSTSRDQGIHSAREGYQRYPGYMFRAQDIDVELTVLPLGQLSEPPLDGDHRPMARASLNQLQALMENQHRS